MEALGVFFVSEAEHMMGDAIAKKRMAAYAERQPLVSDEPVHDGVVAADICGLRERNLMRPPIINHAAAKFASPPHQLPFTLELPALPRAGMHENECGTLETPWQGNGQYFGAEGARG